MLVARTEPSGTVCREDENALSLAVSSCRRVETAARVPLGHHSSQHMRGWQRHGSMSSSLRVE